MPAVKVFNIFTGGQRGPEADRVAKTTVQRFYRAFSVGPDGVRDDAPKPGKITTIVATLDKGGAAAANCDEGRQFVAQVADCIRATPRRRATDKSAPIAPREPPIYQNVDLKCSKSKVDRRKVKVTARANDVNVKQVLSSESGADESNKLSEALESFDRILSEFVHRPNAPQRRDSFVAPILKKSKTCSIIESRCILKKTNSDPTTDGNFEKDRRNSHHFIDKTTSLWNLDDMQGMRLDPAMTPLGPLDGTVGGKSKKTVSRFDTYKITPKTTETACGATALKPEDMKKLDVKTRILKKTLSNPPSAPVQVVGRSGGKKVERRSSDPKKPRETKQQRNRTPTPKTERTEYPKAKLHKSKSVWEIGNEPVPPIKCLERTKSSTSIAGSPSKIPVVRGQQHAGPNKFSSTRALFSPTPGDLAELDRPRESATRRKPEPAARRAEVARSLRTKSQLAIKMEKKETNATKNSVRDYSNELLAARAKLQQRQRKPSEVPCEKQAEGGVVEPSLSPVKLIVKKLELRRAQEVEAPTVRVTSVRVREDARVCSSDARSECSDDSGHASAEPEEAPPAHPVRPARRRFEGARWPASHNAAKIDEQILFRGGVVASLDARREAALARVLERLGARARGVLARRRAHRLRTLHTAARCVQRNVRAFLAVRDWPWWRLLVRITPLLAVHRTEERLKLATEELETLKSKVEKLEQERNHLKQENEQLEAKVSPLFTVLIF